MSHENDDPPDETLVQKAQSGDERAFSTLFDRYFDAVYAYAYRLCLNAHDAEDIAQEAFVRAARHLASLRGWHFKAWIYRIAANLAHDLFRRQHRLTPTDPADLDTMALPAKDSPSASLDLLLQLPIDLRNAVTLVFSEGMTHGEAARILGCAESTVSWRIFLARKKLRKLRDLESSQ